MNSPENDSEEKIHSLPASGRRNLWLAAAAIAAAIVGALVLLSTVWIPGSGNVPVVEKIDQPGNWNRTLVDASDAGLDGAIVAAKRSPDRFGEENGALDFSPTGSRVRATVPDELGSFTLLCWVKIDSLDRWYDSLFLTDGHELHEPHWQIMDDGRLFFSVKKRTATEKLKDKQVFYSPPFWSPAFSGKWLQIATTCDLESRVVTHYLNGKVLSEESFRDEYLVDTVRIGAASIGNWSEPMRDDPRFAVRNFNGSMDEFAIFKTALSASEIAELYEHGKP